MTKELDTTWKDIFVILLSAANWIGHILGRNCLLKQVTEGKIKGEMEATRSRGRRRRKPLDDLKGRRGYSHLKEEALDRTMWRNRFRGGFEPVVRQNTEWMNVQRWNIFACPNHYVACQAINTKYTWLAIFIEMYCHMLNFTQDCLNY